MWELDYKESWALKNWCFWIVVLEKTLESPLDYKEIKPDKRKSVLNIHWKDWCWSWSSNTLATWCEELTTWKRPWCWERLKAGGEGEDRGWDGWMASSTWQTWVWASSGNWWWTGKPGVLQSIGSQRVRHDWVTELIAKNWRAACDNIFVNHNIFILILTPFPLSYKLKIKFIWAIIFIVFKRRLWDSKPRYRFYFNIRITSLTI